MKKYRKFIYTLVLLLIILISVCFIPISVSKLIPTLENQIYEELGIKSHTDKLILRLGPSLKLKAPVMHLMYDDGQKFGQLNNIRFYLPWTALFNNNVKVKLLYADNTIIKLNSNDKYLKDVLSKIQNKEFNENPNIKIKTYNLQYKNAENNKIYRAQGNNLELTKIHNYKNYKTALTGDFYINDKQYINYNISFVPNVEKNKIKNSADIHEVLEQIETLDFHSDIIADIKLYTNINSEMLISGLVNIDNISVLDPEKKYPKSFIYLTFLGNKTGVLSNIYTSTDNKIYVQGVINNSKKPEMDIKVKTDNIELSEAFKKVKLLCDLSRYKKLNNISGRLSADFSLKGDFNKIKSNGFLKISNASVNAGGIKIDKINSDIDFSNSVITVKDTTGYVNNAPIELKGQIDKKLNLEFLMNKVELKNICPESFGIKKGIISIAANLSGTLDNVIHKENVQISDFMLSKDNNVLSFDKLKYDSNKDNTSIISNILIKPCKTEFIKIPLLKAQIESENITIPDTNVFMPNSKLTMNSNIINYNSNLTFNVNADGIINAKDLKINTNSYSVYPVKIIISGNKDVQNINSQILIEKAGIFDEPCLINIDSKYENDVLKLDEVSLFPYTGVLKKNEKPNLKGTKKIIITGNIENLKEPIFKNVRIFIPQLQNITFNDNIAQFKGDIFINGKYNKPEIVGQITIQNLINQFLQLSVSNAVVDFNKNIAVLNAPNIKIADTSLGINSTFLTNLEKQFIIKNLNIKSKYFNTDTLLMYKDIPLLNVLPLTVNEGKFYAEKLSATLYNSPLYLSAVNADLKLKNNVLSLKNLSTEMYNGKLAGSIDFNLKDEQFSANIQGRGMSAAPIFDVVLPKKESISGIIDYDTVLNGNISTKKSLNGNIKFIVHNGHMGTLGKLEHLLYAQNIVADNMLRTSLSVVTKAITLKDTGLFKYLRGDIDMEGGMANIKLLQSQGPLMSLFIKGQYYPMTDYAKLTVLGRLSDEVINGLGAFGEFSFNKLLIMLTGEDNKINITPDDIEKLPQLPVRNTKEFRSVINGILEKPSSVILFNWISYSQKSLKQKDVTQTGHKVPDFIESLPY